LGGLVLNPEMVRKLSSRYYIQTGSIPATLLFFSLGKSGWNVKLTDISI
jgi:hypothetical protein